MEQNHSVPFFMTHHSPVGAWSSFTFGLPGKGVSIDHESPSVEETADFLVALSRGPGKVKAFPFQSGVTVLDNESLQTASKGKAGVAALNASLKERWQFIPLSNIQRRLTPCIDEYSDGEMTLRILTPHHKLPDPMTGDSLEYACCPGFIIELVIDNTRSDEAAFGLLGLTYRSRGRIRPLDWSTDGQLSGIAFSNQWAMAARTEEDQVFTIRNNGIADAVEHGTKVVHNGGQEGGILLRVPAGERKTLTAAFGFFHDGPATQGITGTYYFKRYFKNVEGVCKYLLDHAGQIYCDCKVFDEEMMACPDLRKLQLFAQAVRAYYASTQLIEMNGQPLYNIGEGQYLWRNTMDLAADHIPFELWRNPWVIRNIMDLYIDRYSYRDEIRFQEFPGERFPGGLSFTHDMGSFTSYTPPGTSGYELMNSRSYGYMTAEELLNGIYCFTGYALGTDDDTWAQYRIDTAVELLESVEQRDHADPSKRTGILKGESYCCGEKGHEITTYDCLDSSLLSSVGNFYIAVKTLCAAHLLEAFFRKVHRNAEADRAAAFAAKTEKTLCESFDPNQQCFPANLYQTTASTVIAVIEPLAIPAFLGCIDWLTSQNSLYKLFEQHVRTCLKPGNNLDTLTGGLRLSSASVNTWPSKTILCMDVMEKIFGIPLDDEAPSIMRELMHWMQVSAAEKTVCDQIDSETRGVIGAFYYPRVVTSALWVIHRDNF